MRIPLCPPHLGGNEAVYLQECVATNFVSSVGPFVGRFEREFAAAIASRHAVACASGTAALHIALKLVGVRPGDLVAVSDFTFIASVNAISYLGAEPLLVDSERLSWNLDTQQLHDEVVRRAARREQLPAALLPVHVLGQPADLEPLLALHERFDIPVVEDAAESLGAGWTGGSLSGRWVGTAGRLGAFSFNGNKLLTAGGGGMVVTDDEQLARQAKHLTTQARVPGLDYLHDAVGYNYRLTNVAAAIGVAQLERLDALLTAKRRIAALYDETLVDLPVARLPVPPWGTPAKWLYSLLLQDEPTAQLALRTLIERGIEARPVWMPMHLQPPYRSSERLGGEVAEDLHRRGISLPSGAGLTEEEVRVVASSLREVLAAAARSAVGGGSSLG